VCVCLYKLEKNKSLLSYIDGFAEIINNNNGTTILLYGCKILYKNTRILKKYSEIRMIK